MISKTISTQILIISILLSFSIIAWSEQTKSFYPTTNEFNHNLKHQYTKQNKISTLTTPFSNNNISPYYYNLNNFSLHNITQIKSTTINASERTPFEEITTTNNRQKALDRNDKPYDPSINSTPTPIGDHTIPMSLFAIIWIIIKKLNSHKNNTLS